MVVANGTGRINFDRVEIDGTGYSNGRMFLANGDPAKDINEQAKITFLGGSFIEMTVPADQELRHWKQAISGR